MSEMSMAARPVPRMRTAPNIVSEIKALDPGSEITEYWVRQIMKTGAVPVIRAGKKILVNLDDILELMKTGMELPEPEVPMGEGIRRIDARSV